MNTDLVTEYKSMIEPLFPMAKKAYGSRDQLTPNHEASREYTRLLTEFHEKGGTSCITTRRRIPAEVCLY